MTPWLTTRVGHSPPLTMIMILLSPTALCPTKVPFGIKIVIVLTSWGNMETTVTVRYVQCAHISFTIRLLLSHPGKDYSDVFGYLTIRAFFPIICILFFRRGSTGSTGKATNTQLNLQRWRLGQQTSEISRAEKNDHRLVKPFLTYTSSPSPSLVSCHELLRSLILKIIL